MKMKYDKYWGDPNSLNMLLLIALVLDPRHKLKFIIWYADNHFGSDEACVSKTKYIHVSIYFSMSIMVGLESLLLAHRKTDPKEVVYLIPVALIHSTSQVEAPDLVLK